MFHFFMPRLFFFHPTGIIWLLLVVFSIWMLIDAITSSNLSGGERLVWVLVIFFIPCIGPALYFFLGRRKRAL